MDNVCTRINELVSVRDLGNDHERKRLVRTDRKYIDLQLLRVVMPSADRSKALIYSRNSRNSSNNKRGGKEQFFGRMHLGRVFNRCDPEASGELVYIMQGDKHNHLLWTRDNNMRDNGTLAIGCYFRILVPEFITSYLNNEVLMITSLRPAILMKRPMGIPSVHIRNLAVNMSRACVLNHSQLFIQGIQAIESPCNGNLCDKQRIWN